MDSLGLLAVQGTLKNLLQLHNSKASIIWHSDFFMVQLSHVYMIIGLPRWLRGKESASNVGDPSSIPESGRSPGEGNDNPL